VRRGVVHSSVSSREPDDRPPSLAKHPKEERSSTVRGEVLAMTLKWIVGGAAAGALAALLVWFVGADESVARSRAEPERVAATESAATRDDLARVAATNDARTSAPLETAPAPVDADFGALVVGRVVDTAGAPVQRATVEMKRSEPAGGERVEPLYASTSGAWSAIDVVPADHELRVSAPGFVTAAETLHVASGATCVHETVLVRALSLPLRIEDTTGVLLDFNSGPLGIESHIGVAVTRERPTDALPRNGRQSGHPCASLVLRDIFGSTELPPDLGERYCGLLVMNEVPPLWATLAYGDVIVESRQIVGDEHELVFVVDPEALRAGHGSVRVRVVDAQSGEPLTSGIVLDSPQGGPSIEPQLDGDTLVFSDLKPGSLDLMCELPEYEYLEREVAIRPRTETDLGTIALGRRATFEVRLVDESGAPVAGTVVRTSRRDLWGSVEDGNTRMGIGGKNGVWKVGLHALGRTLIRVGGNDGLAMVAVEVDTSVVNPVEIVVPRGVDVAFEWTGEWPATATFVLEGANGVPLATSLGSLMCLASGAYTWVVRNGTTEVARRAFSIGSEKTTITVEAPQ